MRRKGTNPTRRDVLAAGLVLPAVVASAGRTYAQATGPGPQPGAAVASGQQNSSSEQKQADYLIIGGGAAGCVLASRLSEDPNIRVIVLEAGPDLVPNEEPDTIRDARFRSLFDPTFMWPGLQAENSPGRAASFLPQARILGGGSSINGMHAQRGAPADYDGWSRMGAIGWDWEGVLPFFKRLETDRDFEGPLHGMNGLIPVTRFMQPQWSGFSRAIGEAFERQGIPAVDDMNGMPGDAVGPLPLNIEENRRVSVATTYLSHDVRRRRNLEIRTQTTVERLIIQDNRVIGAQLADGSTIQAGETVLSAGAVFSPTLLMRSGIGPGEHLQQVGIPVAVDRFGVGQNLQNHPSVTLAVHLRSNARQNPDMQPASLMMVRFSSGLKDCPPADMRLTLWERTPGALADDPVSRQVANLGVTVNKPFSTGTVRLDPGAPSNSPQIAFNLLSDDRDHQRLIDGVRRFATLLEEQPVAGTINEVFLPGRSSLVGILLQDSWRAQMLSYVGSWVMNGPSFLRGQVIESIGTPLSDVLAEPNRLVDTVKKSASPAAHVVGTCRMGDPHQRETVVDPRTRFVGLDGLRIVDASIFPTLITAGTHLSVIMAAEKAAQIIKEDRGA